MAKLEKKKSMANLHRGISLAQLTKQAAAPSTQNKFEQFNKVLQRERGRFEARIASAESSFSLGLESLKKGDLNASSFEKLVEGSEWKSIARTESKADGEERLGQKA